MPTTTPVIPTPTQISEPLTKANAIAVTKTAATAIDEPLKTLKILKSILKTNESFTTNTTSTSSNKENQVLVAEEKSQLHLNVSKSSKLNEIENEVDIKPKKAAPKSPQITSYIPVYTTKSLTSGSPVKNNDNIEPVDNQDEVEETETYTTQVEEAEARQTVEANTDDTPILANLIVYKELQESTRNCANISTTLDSVDSHEGEHFLKNTKEESNNEEDSATACEEYIDDDMDEEFTAEADSNKENVNFDKRVEPVQIYVNEQFKRDEQLEEQFIDESHYLPMTPKRVDFGQDGDIFALSLNDSNAEEENPYVEMTKFLQDEEAKTSYEVMCIGKYNMPSVNKNLEKVKQLNEPVYMELPGASSKKSLKLTSTTTKEPVESEDLNTSTGKSLLKKCKKGGDTLKKKVKKTSERVQNKRKDLPDILKPPQSTINMASDSSDADDESSKQMDLKKMRSRTRFSLSDTFRPASYYLGASTGLDNFAESSDSEIVSPPPIPSSPLLMDELKTEEIFSSENYDTVKRRDSSNSSKLELSCNPLPKIHSSNISLDMPKAEATLKSSRLSLPDQLSKARNNGNNFKTQTQLLKHHERTLSDSNYSFQTDNSSNTSSDFDLYNKLKLSSPSFVVTPIRYQSNSSLPQKYTLNASSIMAPGDSSEAESVELRHSQTSDSELEKQRSRRPLSQESIDEIELLNEKFEERMTSHDLDTYLSNLETSDLQLYQNSTLDATGATGILTGLIKPPEVFRNKDDENFYGNINFASSSDSLQKVDNDKLAQDLQNLTPTSTDQEQTQNDFYTPMHSRNNSNISEQSAPYYYSELNSSREMLSTPTTLNNQRDIHAPGSNITHIHNPIEKSNISVEMLTDKYQASDNSKNLYKSSVEKLSYSPGKNLKTNETQNASSNTSHIFHLQHIASPPIKMSNHHTNKQNHANITDISHTPSETHGAKSTNITMSQVEGHLSGGGLDICPKTEGSNLIHMKSESEIKLKDMGACSKSASKLSSFLGEQNSGELLWEEDALWRESLRRVSQRHAKSLDDLDRIAPNLSCVKREPQKAKITRDVTYVNDHISPHMRASLKKTTAGSDALLVTDDDDRSCENDVYVQLMQQKIEQSAADDEDHLGKSDDLYEMLREDTSSTMSHKSAEIDRETIRQWDAMSSGITTKNNNHNNNHNNNNNNNNSNNNNSNEASEIISSDINTVPALSVQAIVQQLNANSSLDDKSNPASALRKPSTMH